MVISKKYFSLGFLHQKVDASDGSDVWRTMTDPTIERILTVSLSWLHFLFIHQLCENPIGASETGFPLDHFVFRGMEQWQGQTLLAKSLNPSVPRMCNW